jgi:hypothetical protein
MSARASAFMPTSCESSSGEWAGGEKFGCVQSSWPLDGSAEIKRQPAAAIIF